MGLKLVAEKIGLTSKVNKRRPKTRVNDKEHELEKVTIRRETPNTSDIQVRGNIEGVNVTFVIDTGADKTLVSKRLFDRIYPSHQPHLGGKVKLTHAGGDTLRNYGRCNMKIQLGTSLS